MSFPVAMQPPKGSLNLISDEMLASCIALSRESPRKRIILPLHKSDGDALHRMLNAIQPGSYIRPHSHIDSGKAESIILLRGSICYLTFSAEGQILTHQVLRAGSAAFGVDTEPEVIHSFYALEADTVIFECKPGPYVRTTDKGFASWAPAEGTEEAQQFLQQIIAATEQ